MLRTILSQIVRKMIENWDQYKDLEYYPDRLCACGCGGRLKVDHMHKYRDSIPEYIHGHNGRGLKVPRETRICANPNCDVVFEVAVTRTQKFCSTECQLKHVHECNQRSPSKETCKKIAESISKCYMEGHRTFQPGYKSGYVYLEKFDLSLFFRSSYEEKALLFLENLRGVVDVDTEAIRIKYEDKEGYTHYYLPDILVKDEKGNCCLIEVKPSYQLEDEVNQLKFRAGVQYSLEHNMKYLIWTEDMIFSNKNGSTTELSLQAIVEATAATLSESGKVMIQSELHRNMQRQEETTCPPTNVG